MLDTKWIDVNKGDSAHPNFRSILVGREYNEYRGDTLYASTRPLEAMRMIISDAATHEGGEQQHNAKRRDLMVNGLSRAYFNAPAKRALCMEVPMENIDAKEGERAPQCLLVRNV